MSDDLTPLDVAHMAADAEPEDDAARLRFYGVLADSELFLLLRAESTDAEIAPAIFALEEGRFAMAFDSEERLAAFTGETAPYAAIPGRVLVGELAGKATGLGLNLGVAPSTALLPPEAVDWLAGLLALAPDAPVERPLAIEAPDPAAGALQEALAGVMANLARTAQDVVFVTAVYLAGRQAALAVIGAEERAQAAMARAVNDALAFSGMPVAAVDVMFLPSDDVLADVARRVGARVAGAAAGAVGPSAPVGPGMDPSRPPRLR